MKVKRYDGDCCRIMSDDDAIVGLALRLANDLWGAFDTNERRLTRQSFETPGGVRYWFEQQALAADASKEE